MSKNVYASSLALCLSMATSSAFAVESLSLQKTTIRELRQTFQLVYPGFSPRAATPKQDTLQFVNEHTDANHVTHVRMQQQYHGFPVYGSQVILHAPFPSSKLLSQQEGVSMNGLLYRGLQDELGQPAPTFVSHAARALAQFKLQYQNVTISDEEVTPIVYIDSNHHALWAYKVSVLVSYSDKIPERPTAIVDANTMKPLLRWNAIKTMKTTVSGLGFGGNPKIGEHQYGKDFPALPISRDEASNLCYMENKDVKVVDMGHRYSGTQNTMRFGCKKNDELPFNTYWTGYKGDGYDKKNGAYSPSNDALFAGVVIKNMYKEWFDLEVLQESGKPMRLVMRVHYGEGYENAYWDGQQMTFGDGEDMLYPLVSLGIGAHEISHGFTEQHSNLEYYGQSGGINESFSDMAAQAAEYYAQGKNTWAIGSEVMKEDSGLEALRFMDKPSRDGKSIDSADQFNDNMNVHYSSGVFNRLFYLLSNLPDWDVKKAFHVMVKANMDYWTPLSTFDEASCGVIEATRDLGFSIDDVQQTLKQVMLQCV